MEWETSSGERGVKGGDGEGGEGSLREVDIYILVTYSLVLASSWQHGWRRRSEH